MGDVTIVFKQRLRARLWMVAREWLEYRKNKYRAIVHPDEYCSIIVDCVYQSGFIIPHFSVRKKTERSNSFKLRPVGLLEHSQQNIINLYTLKEEEDTGANHVV